MKKTVLVFGANGNLGSHFVNKALEAGYNIKAFVRSPEKYTLSDKPNVEVVQGDATHYDDVEKAVSGVDIIVSCLGNPPKKKIYIMDKAYENIMLVEEFSPFFDSSAAVSKTNRHYTISIRLAHSAIFFKLLLTWELIKSKHFSNI